MTTIGVAIGTMNATLAIFYNSIKIINYTNNN